MVIPCQLTTWPYPFSILCPAVPQDTDLHGLHSLAFLHPGFWLGPANRSIKQKIDQCVQYNKSSFMKLSFQVWPQIVDTFSIWMCVPKYVYSQSSLGSLCLRTDGTRNSIFFGPVNWMGGVSGNMLYCVQNIQISQLYVLCCYLYCKAGELGTYMKKHNYHPQQNTRIYFFNPRNTIFSEALKSSYII